MDPIADEQLAQFVVSSHIRSHPDGLDSLNITDFEVDDNINSNGCQPLDQAILKKYIMYARTFVKPILHEVDIEKVSYYYLS